MDACKPFYMSTINQNPCNLQPDIQRILYSFIAFKEFSVFYHISSSVVTRYYWFAWWRKWEKFWKDRSISNKRIMNDFLKKVLHKCGHPLISQTQCLDFKMYEAFQRVFFFSSKIQYLWTQLPALLHTFQRYL